MIYPVEMYGAGCDNCGTEYYNDHHGWAAMNDRNGIWELMDNDDWIEDDGKHYCPDCFTHDDEDNLIINTERTKTQPCQ